MTGPVSVRGHWQNMSDNMKWKRRSGRYSLVVGAVPVDRVPVGSGARKQEEQREKKHKHHSHDPHLTAPHSY
ncbi:hypothetical protein XELAEV_18043008mg [Xenopus laevis]|uniref:Uncharacterized protein n=1 Tax=Xenopus laevis TaxID=8355 RepID=A0A974C520_XENLA|nr:hypothetical protein XELAEV_18043008mg [Xenopus laevis]